MGLQRTLSRREEFFLQLLQLGKGQLGVWLAMIDREMSRLPLLADFAIEVDLVVDDLRVGLIIFWSRLSLGFFVEIFLDRSGLVTIFLAVGIFLLTVGTVRFLHSLFAASIALDLAGAITAILR